jgi:putative transcriptional regulator
MTVKTEIAKGRLLVSKPAIIGDPSFGRSVILITEHNHEGSVGFILNRPVEFLLEREVDGHIMSYTLHEGGPVDDDNLYFIHSVPELIPGSISIADGLYWGGDFESILGLLSRDLIKDEEIKFFLGYSGWAFQQLEDEVNGGTWNIMENTVGKNILSTRAEDIWKESMMKMGGSNVLWANAPDNPNLN